MRVASTSISPVAQLTLPGVLKTNKCRVVGLDSHLIVSVNLLQNLAQGDLSLDRPGYKICVALPYAF